jgi:hypothetical protein
VFLGIHDVDQADELFGEPEIDVEVAGDDLTDEDVEKITGFYRPSPVYNLVTLAHENDPEVHVESA